jgi:hypothetical protein
MNKEQLAKSVGKEFRLRPMVTRVLEDGTSLDPLDDKWRLESITDKVVRLLNTRMGHKLELGIDNLREFRSPDFLLSKCNVTLKGREILIEPFIEKPIKAAQSALAVKVDAGFRTLSAKSELHEYCLRFGITNNGEEALQGVGVELSFPTEYLRSNSPFPGMQLSELIQDGLKYTRYQFHYQAMEEAARRQFISNLYPGNTLWIWGADGDRLISRLHYFVDQDNYENVDRYVVRWKVFANGRICSEGNKPFHHPHFEEF